MTALTALAAHIKASNDKTRAWVAESPDTRFAGLLSEDIAHWAARGITTVEQFEHAMAVEHYYNMYKDIYGIKPRWMDFDSMTAEDINLECKEMCDRHEASIAAIEAEEAASKAAEEAALTQARAPKQGLTYNPFAALLG